MQRIFAYQARGDISNSIRSTELLDNPLLLGTVLADRYGGHYYRATIDQLSNWLEQYGDQPDAPILHALLLTRLPKGSELSPFPSVAEPTRTASLVPIPADVDPPRRDLTRDLFLDRTVMERAQQGNTAAALRLIGTARGISRAYVAQLRAEVAQTLFSRNEDAEALSVAQLAVSGNVTLDQPNLGFYIGGLAAWRLDRIEVARDLFEAGASSPNTSARIRAASAFWASRASRALKDPVSAFRWLRAATEERLTLHGLLARRLLRMDTGIPSTFELVGQADVDAVAATPQGQRAFALLQVGQTDRAASELRDLWSKSAGDAVFARSLLLVATATGCMDCAAQMVASLQSKDSSRQEELRFPIPRLRPAGGFSIDPTLVYAVTRIESNFNPGAISPAGARGLMQIMPSTAQYITGNLQYTADRLHEPGSNLQIGQRYISYLASKEGIDNNLLRILASYNSGPANFGRWGADIRDHGDPLLFIEAIPVNETRSFVQRALVYSWIYAARMHLPASSLEHLAAGEFPRFASPGFVPAPAQRKVVAVTADSN